MKWLIAVAMLAFGTTFAFAETLEDQRRQIAPLVAGLSAADRAVLRAGLGARKQQLMTTEGTANFELWSKLAEWGYLREVSPTTREPGELANTGRLAQSIAAMGVQMKVFAVTRKGLDAIPKLLGPKVLGNALE